METNRSEANGEIVSPSFIGFRDDWGERTLAEREREREIMFCSNR